MATQNFIADDHESVTDLGISFIEEGTEKRFKKKEIDVYLDGTSLNPLIKEFAWRYNSYLISEDDYSYFTKKDGSSKIRKPFAPDLVHTPIRGDQLVEGLTALSPDKRSIYGIPTGLDQIESFSFTMLTIPILVSLSDNGSAQKFVVNGFSHSGETQYLEEIVTNLEPKLKGVMVQLKINKSKGDGENSENEYPVVFNNWFEVDKSDFGHDRIFSFSREDFTIALQKEYGFNLFDAQNIECTDNELIVHVTRDMLASIDTAETHYKTGQPFTIRKIVENIVRGRDYIPYSPFGSGVWLLFVSFQTNDSFVEFACEVLETFDSSEKYSVMENIVSLKKPQNVSLRKVLVMLGLLDLLEQIDMLEYIYIPADNE